MENETPEINKGGRPKETVADSLWEGWQDDVLELYEEGGSDVEVKALIYRKKGSFSNNLWDRWAEEESEFWETIKMGRMLAAAWWKENGRTNLKNKEFSYTGWYMQMKNRYGWADKQETKHSGEIKQTIEETDTAELQKRLEEGIKSEAKQYAIDHPEEFK